MTSDVPAELRRERRRLPKEQIVDASLHVRIITGRVDMSRKQLCVVCRYRSSILRRDIPFRSRVPKVDVALRALGIADDVEAEADGTVLAPEPFEQ